MKTKQVDRINANSIAKTVYALAESTTDPLGPMVKEALEVIDEGLDTHGMENVSMSFNGGKDCTVLLHLLAGALARRSDPNSPPRPIPSLYIPVPSPFPVLDAFIEESIQHYNLDQFYAQEESEDGRLVTPPAVESVITPSLPNEGSDYIGVKPSTPQKAVGKAKGSDGMLHALEMYKAEYPHISAIIMGTRSTDPHGATLTYRNQTDSNWPAYERINPIIHWSYAQVWDFLRRLDVPYCVLYDEGYTSLGSTYNTFPNPALQIWEPSTPENKTTRFRPAYELQDGNLERAGRGSKPAAHTHLALSS